MGFLDKAREKLEGLAGGVRGSRSQQEEWDHRNPTQVELEREEAEMRKQSAEREADASRPRS